MISTLFRPSSPSTCASAFPVLTALHEIFELLVVPAVGDRFGITLARPRRQIRRANFFRIPASLRADGSNCQSKTSSCSTIAEPCVHWISVFLRESGKDARRRLDHPQRAVLETDRRHPGVFDFDSLVGQRAGEGGHFGDLAHEPLQEIDIVDRLVHVGAAAVEFPCAAPSAVIVIFLRPPPFDVRVSEGELAESPFVDGFFERAIGRAEARRKDRAQLDGVFLARGDQLVAAGQRDFERLFDDDVLSRRRRRDRRLEMRPAGRADIDDVESWMREELIVVGVNRTAAGDGRDLFPALLRASRVKSATVFAPRISLIARA